MVDANIEDIFDRNFRAKKGMDKEETIWVMSVDRPEAGKNLAGFDIPTGPVAQFIRDELGVDPKFFCFSRDDYYALIQKSQGGAGNTILLLEKRYWATDQKWEYDRIVTGDWETVEDSYYDLGDD